MDRRRMVRCTRPLFVALVCLLLAVPGFAAMKKWAVIAPGGSRLQDVSLADLAKFCKGSQKTWPDGKNFMLVMHDPELPEMRPVVQALFGVAPAEVKDVLAKLNQSRVVVRVVDTDDELLRIVSATPGAIGVLDVYAINSSVKVLRIDGKLPFDVGYALKGS